MYKQIASVHGSSVLTVKYLQYNTYNKFTYSTLITINYLQLQYSAYD